MPPDVWTQAGQTYIINHINENPQTKAAQNLVTSKQYDKEVKVACIREIIFVFIFHYASEQWRPSLIITIKKKVSTCSSKYQMNDKIRSFFKGSYTKQKWHLQTDTKFFKDYKSGK